MSEGFAGDPFHEGGSQPMAGLKGGMEQPNTQMPAEGSNDTNSNQHDAPISASWNATSLAPGHPTTGSNDKNKAH